MEVDGVVDAHTPGGRVDTGPRSRGEEVEPHHEPRRINRTRLARPNVTLQNGEVGPREREVRRVEDAVPVVEVPASMFKLAARVLAPLAATTTAPVFVAASFVVPDMPDLKVKMLLAPTVASKPS